MCKGCAYTYPPLPIARFSLIQLSELEQCRVNKLVQGFNTTAQDSNQVLLVESPKLYPGAIALYKRGVKSHTGTCRVEDHSKSHRYMSCGRSFQESQVHVVWKIIPRVTGTCRVEDHSKSHRYMSCGRSFQESQVHVVWKIIPRVTGTCHVEDHSKSHRYMSCGRSFQESQVHVVWKIIPRVTGTCRVEDHSKSHRYMSCGRSFQESQVHVVWKIIPRVTGTCRVEDHSKSHRYMSCGRSFHRRGATIYFDLPCRDCHQTVGCFAGPTGGPPSGPWDRSCQMTPLCCSKTTHPGPWTQTHSDDSWSWQRLCSVTWRSQHLETYLNETNSVRIKQHCIQHTSNYIQVVTTAKTTYK